MLGAISLAKDWGVAARGHVWMDSTAGIAIGSRRGLGKVKHIDTVFLWVQEVINAGRVAVGKKHTTEMLADILTKSVGVATMTEMLKGMEFHFMEGRHELSLRA